MINSYNPIETLKGWYFSGIYSVLIAPREWLLAPVERNNSTGVIAGIPELENPYQYIPLEFAPETYGFEEKPKTNKQGPFFETHLEGTTNNLSAEILLTLETLRYHEFVAIIKTRKKETKFVGNKDNGLILQFSNKEVSKTGGNQEIAIDLQNDFEQAAAFIAL